MHEEKNNGGKQLQNIKPEVKYMCTHRSMNKVVKGSTLGF